MGKLLYEKFLEEMADECNLHDIMLFHGARGLLDTFEDWLVDRGYLKRKGGEYEKWMFDND